MLLPLDSFCADMRRLGDLIEARSEMLPTCGTPERGGLHVALSADGSRYILTDRDKDFIVTLVESSDEEVVMESLFDNVTQNMAIVPPSEGHSDAISPTDPAAIPNLTGAEMRQGAITFQKRLSEGQEALLGRINPKWRDHQAKKNAQRLKYIEDNFWP